MSQIFKTQLWLQAFKTLQVKLACSSYAHRKILVDVKEWTFAESQSEYRNLISRVKRLLQYSTILQLLMANHCILVVLSLLGSSESHMFYRFPSCLPLSHYLLSSRICRKQLITAKRSSYPSICAAQSSLSLTAKRARSFKSACLRWMCAGTTYAAWSKSGAAHCRMH